MTPQSPDQLRDLALLVAAGEATPEERAAFGQWRATGDPAAEGAWAEAQATLAALPEALDAVPPTDAQWRRLERSLTAVEPADSKPRRLWPVAAPLALAAAAVAGLVTWLAVAGDGGAERQVAELRTTVDEQLGEIDSQQSEIDRQRATLADQGRALDAQQAALTQQQAVLAEQRQQLDAVSARLDDALRQLQFVTEPTGPFAALEATGEMPGVTGRAFLDERAGRARWSVAGLTPPAADQTYQAWGIPDGGDPVPVTTFAVAPDGTATFEADLPAGLTPATLAVSLEPAGGSETPTGPIVALGDVRR